MAFLSGNGYGQVEKTLRETPGALDQFKQMLGVDLQDVFGLFEGEFAFWVGRGARSRKSRSSPRRRTERRRWPRSTSSRG